MSLAIKLATDTVMLKRRTASMATLLETSTTTTHKDARERLEPEDVDLQIIDADDDENDDDEDDDNDDGKTGKMGDRKSRDNDNETNLLAGSAT